MFSTKRVMGSVCVSLLGACSHQTAEPVEPNSVVSSGEIVWMAEDQDQAPQAEANDQAQATAGAEALAAPQPEQMPEQPAAPEPAAAEEAAKTAQIEHPAEDEASPSEQAEDGISRFVLTRGVTEREPIDEDAKFQPGERIYAYMQFKNSGEPYDIVVRWEQVDAPDAEQAPAKADGEGSDQAKEGAEEIKQAPTPEPIQVTVGTSSRWRTWSWTRAANTAGTYRCVVETADGEPLSVLEYEITSED